MADDRIPASPTPAGDPLPATPASVQPLDFSAVPGHQQHGPAPQPNVHVDPAAQYVKNTETQQAGEKEYSDFLYKNSPDEYRKADPVGYFARKIHGVISEAAARGIEHDPEYLKQAVAPHVQALADFASGQLGVTPGSLGHTAGLAASPLMPEGGFNMEDAASVQRVPEGVETPANLKSANPKLKNALPARPEVGQKINFDAVAGHEEVAPPQPSAPPEHAAYETPHLKTEPKTQPNDQVANSAQRYNSARGHGQIDHTPQELPSQEERNQLADSYDRAKHEPENPAVARAYDAMKRETLDQFNHAKNDLGIKFDFTKEDPYKSAEEMQKDVRENHHLSTFTEGTPLAKDHPLAEIEPTTGQTYNNIFRATHDIFGHSAGGHDFSEAGEENAYQAHKQMYSKEAVPAVQNETQGQANHYFNNERARNGAEKVFPEQKATIIHSPEVGQTPEPESPNADKQTKFPDYPLEQRLADLKNEKSAAPGGYTLDTDTLVQRARKELGDKAVHSINEPYVHKFGDGEAWLAPDGKTTIDLEEDRDHSGLAADLMTNSDAAPTSAEKYGAHDAMLTGGWVRKNGPTDYEVHQITPKAVDTIEKAADANGAFGKEIRIDTKNSNFESGAAGPGRNLRVNTITIPKGWENLDAEVRKQKGYADIPESQQTATPETGYHPTLQAIADKYGVTEDPYAVRNGASFITPDGKYIHLGSTSHDDAILAAGGPEGSGDPRIPFLNDSGAIRTRVSFDRAGHTIHISVPKDGVTPEQIQALKEATQKSVGKNGNVVMERADLTAETKDQLSKTKEFGNANDIEPMLHQIQAHPDDKWYAQAGKRAEKEPAGGIDPRTGKSDTEGHGTEIFPEKRMALDHAPTKEDFQNFYDQNKELFDQHPELKIGWDNDSKVPGGHEINIGAVGKGAKRVAKKLEQRAAFDIGKGEEIPTGGEGLRTEFPNYPLAERIKDLNGEPQSDIKGFESLSPEFHANLEPDERAYLKDNNLLQSNAMAQYHKIQPSVNETTNAMQAGAALGGWWQRYIDVFHGLADGGEQAAKQIGPSHAEVLKQWHAAVSGNKAVEDANNLAWHSYADWLDAGKPTDRKSIDDIVRKNAAQPEGSGKKGNAAISDTRTKSGKIKSPGLDTTKLFNLVNSPEMKGERPFSGQVFSEEQKNPLMGTTEGARKIPSMGATVAGKGNLNRLVIDAHIRDFYGHKQSGGPAAQYIADSVHLRQAAKALGLKGGEGQEQLWGTVLGLKTLLKEGLTPAEASGKLNADVINQIGKDYAEVIANDPEIPGVLDRLKKLGVGRGSAGLSETNLPARSASAGPGGPGSSEAGIDKIELEKTAGRIREQISPSKIKKPASSTQKASEGGWLKMMTAPITKAKLPPK